MEQPSSLHKHKLQTRAYNVKRGDWVRLLADMKVSKRITFESLKLSAISVV